MRILGIDPGLTRTGYGIIDVVGNTLTHVANGFFQTAPSMDLPHRLVFIYKGLAEVLKLHTPSSVAVEETFVNPKASASSALVLGHARGIALLVPALLGLPVSSYAPNTIKKALTGVGHADKKQVQFMVQRFLPLASIDNADSADALATAICHWHHLQSPYASHASLERVVL